MKERVLTALVAIPLVLAVVGCTNPWPLFGLVLATTVACALELSGLLNVKDAPAKLLGGVASVAAVAFLPLLTVFPDATTTLSFLFIGQNPVILFVESGLFLLGMASAWRAVRPTAAKFDAVLAVFWFAVPLACLWQIHPKSRYDEWAIAFPVPIFIVLLPVWAGDTAAMLGGKAFGKHKLAPTISPNKTWEGAIANFIAAVAVGWGVGAWLGYETWVGPACGAAVGVFGQLGDLFESALKRAAGKKDSGTLLPGHGGVLDRIDALLGAVIPVWLILHFSGSLA